MNRRDFAKTAAGAAVAAAFPAHSLLDAAEIKPAVPLKLSVMLWTINKQLPFERRLAQVAEAGYAAVELVNEFEKWSDEDFRRMNNEKRSLGITFDATAGVWKGIADPAGRDEFLSDLQKFFAIAHKLECPGIIVLSGNRVAGVSSDAHPNACIEALKRAAALAAKQA